MVSIHEYPIQDISRKNGHFHWEKSMEIEDCQLIMGFSGGIQLLEW